MSETQPGTTEPAAPSGPQPKKWWQWVLVYPVMVTSLFASVLTLVEAFRSQKYDVAFGFSRDAADQHDLWQKNLDCTTAPFDWLTTKNNVKVDATICRSGDVLVRAKSPDEKSYYRWVSVSSVVQDRWSLGLVDSAWAAEPPREIVVAQLRVICQRWVANGILLRRISTPNGCFDEIVNTYSGRVESTRPAPCDPRC